MAYWLALTSGLHINLELIEAIEPSPSRAGEFRFYPPRTQRGGRPIGRPTGRPASYQEHDGYWEGTPVRPEELTEALTAASPQAAAPSDASSRGSSDEPPLATHPTGSAAAS